MSVAVTADFAGFKRALKKGFTPPKRRAEALAYDEARPGVGLIDLRSCGCRWPLERPGPVLFCGAVRAPGKPYCAHHHTRSFTGRTADSLRVVKAAVKRAEKEEV